MKDVVTSRRFILEALRKVSMISFDWYRGDSCLVYSGATHDVETCSTTEELLQGMMDKGMFEVCGARRGEQDVGMKSADKS